MANSFDRITMLHIIIKQLKAFSIKLNMSHSLLERSIRRFYKILEKPNLRLLLASTRDVKLDQQYLK